jgi:hypothetical protein
MRTVKGYIASKQRELDAHPLLDQLRRDEPGTLEWLAPRLTFPVMVLQDLIRKTEQLVNTPSLKPIARQIRVAARGRDRRFLRNLAALGLPQPTVQGLFARAHEVARLASYAIASEAYLAPDDACRIALLLAVESAERSLYPFQGETPVVDESAEATLSDLEIAAESRRKALAIVHRCHQALWAMLDDVECSSESAAVSSSARSSARAIAFARTMLAPAAMLAR